MPGWHFCASILTIRLETRSAPMNLLVTTYTSSTSLSSPLSSPGSFGYSQLSASGFPGPSVEIPLPEVPGLPSPYVSLGVSSLVLISGCSSSMCRLGSRRQRCSSHRLSDLLSLRAHLNTPRHWLSEPPEGAARGEHQSCQG